MRIILVLILFMVCGHPVLAQFQMPKEGARELLEKAHGAVIRMGSGLPDLGNRDFEPFEKQGLARSIKEEFESADVMVVNDIDPLDNTGRTLKLDVYLQDIIRFYDKYGIDIETSICLDSSNVLYQDIDGEFLFVKVVCKRKLTGTHNFNGPIDKEHLLDFYVSFELKNDSVIDRPKIYSCTEHVDNEGHWKRVLIKEDVELINVSSTIHMVPQKVAEPPKPKQEMQAEKTVENIAAIPGSPCAKPDADAYFISQTNPEREWLFYYENSEIYKKAVKQKVSGRVSAQVVILPTGLAVEGNIKVTILKGVSDENALSTYSYIILYLIRESKGWSPAIRNCVPVEDTVTVEVVFSDCTELITKAKLNGNSNIKQEWKRYVGQNPRFMQAVFKEDVRGPADVSFEVGKSGTVTAHSIETSVGQTMSNQYNGMKTLDALVLGSDRWKSGWWPRMEHCTRTDQKVKLKVKFKPRWVDPRQVANNDLFSSRKKKKWKNRAEWADWKDEKLGGVHFSLGALWAMPLSVSRNYRPFEWFDGMLGLEASLGGMFGHVGGLEVRYRFLNPRNELGLGLLLNASPRRWPARFYFPIHFNVSWNYHKQVFIGPSVGLLCLDVKLAKKVSMYFDLLRGTAEFGTNLGMENDTDTKAKAIGLQAFYYSPSIGLRFCRW